MAQNILAWKGATDHTLIIAGNAKNQPMNEFRRQHLIDKKKSIEELFEKIKDNPKPQILSIYGCYMKLIS